MGYLRPSSKYLSKISQNRLRVLLHRFVKSSQWSDSTYPPQQMSPSSNSSAVTTSSVAMDGSTDRIFGGRTSKVQNPPANVSAIFVHAGAGYHSTTNEHIHLGACNEYVLLLSWPRLMYPAVPFVLTCVLLVLPKWQCVFSNLVVPQ